MKSNIELYNESEEEKRFRFEKEEAYLRAKKKVEKIQGFYWHLLIYIIVNTVLIVTSTDRTDLPFWSFWTFSTAIFWGIGLAFHFLGVFGQHLIFGKDWEQRQIEKYMNKDKKRWE